DVDAVRGRSAGGPARRRAVEVEDPRTALRPDLTVEDPTRGPRRLLPPGPSSACPRRCPELRCAAVPPQSPRSLPPRASHTRRPTRPFRFCSGRMIADTRIAPHSGPRRGRRDSPPPGRGTPAPQFTNPRERYGRHAPTPPRFTWCRGGGGAH